MIALPHHFGKVSPDAASAFFQWPFIPIMILGLLEAAVFCARFRQRYSGVTEHLRQRHIEISHASVENRVHTLNNLSYWTVRTPVPY